MCGVRIEDDINNKYNFSDGIIQDHIPPDQGDDGKSEWELMVTRASSIDCCDSETSWLARV